MSEPYNKYPDLRFNHRVSSLAWMICAAVLMVVAYHFGGAWAAGGMIALVELLDHSVQSCMAEIKAEVRMHPLIPVSGLELPARDPLS